MQIKQYTTTTTKTTRAHRKFGKQKGSVRDAQGMQAKSKSLASQVLLKLPKCIT